MPRSRERRNAALRSFAIRLAAIVLITLAVAPAPSLAQATGHVRLTFAKAGLGLGGGGGSGVLTYRGHAYRFNFFGYSLGMTVGATIGRFEGRASGIREIGDFAGIYSSAGGGAALVGGVGGVHLRNGKGVDLMLRGPKAGVEFAANLSAIMISLK